MPVDDTVLFGQFDGDQTTPPGPALALPGIRGVQRTVGGTDDELTTVVKKTIGLKVQFHRHMGAAVHISTRLPFVADGKSPTCLDRKSTRLNSSH